jgi:hypothetical protein
MGRLRASARLKFATFPGARFVRELFALSAPHPPWRPSRRRFHSHPSPCSPLLPPSSLPPHHHIRPCPLLAASLLRPSHVSGRLYSPHRIQKHTKRRQESFLNEGGAQVEATATGLVRLKLPHVAPLGTSPTRGMRALIERASARPPPPSIAHSRLHSVAEPSSSQSKGPATRSTLSNAKPQGLQARFFTPQQQPSGMPSSHMDELFVTAASLQAVRSVLRPILGGTQRRRHPRRLVLERLSQPSPHSSHSCHVHESVPNDRNAPSASKGRIPRLAASVTQTDTLTNKSLSVTLWRQHANSICTSPA